jgi:retron-type reverse transcriptase
VLEKENLNIAWEAMRANKGEPRPDWRDIASSQAHMHVHWQNIEAKLRSGEYNPDPVLAVTIPKPNGGERTLGVPNVQDRLIQQAINAKLSSRCEPFFSENSYGFSARCGLCKRNMVFQGEDKWQIQGWANFFTKAPRL